MDSGTPLVEISVGDLESIIDNRVKDIPSDYFMAAVDKRIVSIGVELTGKNITDHKEARCVRLAFENTLKCQKDKEKMREVFLTEGTKKIFHWAVTAVLVGWLTFLKFGTG